MKKQLLLLFFGLFYGLSNAQSVGTQSFSGYGYDDETSIVTINSSDITVNLGQPITQIKIINSVLDYWGDECGDYYDFTLVKDGVPVISNGCDVDFENFVVTGFTTLEIYATDLDISDDFLIIDFDLEITYQTPSCLQPTDVITSNMTTNSMSLSWTAGGSETAWIVEYGAPGFTAGSGTIINVTSLPVNIPGLTFNTDYEFRIKSDCGGGDVSNTTIFNTRLGYCVSSIAYTSDYITGFSTTGAIQNVTYSATSYSAYVDNTSTLISGYAGLTFNFESTYVGGDNTIKIWVDWNNNYAFEASEVVFVNYASSANQSGTITIPSGTALGNYRMRILSRYSDYVATEACGSFNYGNTIDYTVNVINPPSCLPVTNLQTSNATASTIDLSWTVGATETSWNIEYGAPGFTAGTGTLLTVTAFPVTIPGLTQNTTYEFRVQADCGAGSTSAWTNITKYFGYCVPGSTSTSYYINSVTTTGALTNLANTNTGYSAGGYGNFTTQNFNAYAGQAITITGTHPTGTYGTAIWIDLNNNYSFEASEKIYGTTSYTNGFNTNYTIPASVTNGTYRVRILSDYYSPAPNNACSTNIAGEVEDYTLTIVSAPSCLPVSNTVITAQNSNSATLTWTAGGTETSWKVEFGLKGFTQGSGTASVVSSATITLNNLTAITDYDVYITADCGAGDLSFVNGPNTFKTYLECGSVFTDNGGATGNYTTDTTITWKICANTPDQLVKVDFTSFELEEDDGLYYYDNLKTYKGTTLFSTNWGNDSPGTIISDLGGCLTFVFTSDDQNEFSGWTANITCVSCNPTAGTNGAETICSLDNTIDLNTVIQSSESGTWKLDAANGLITNNGDLNVGILAPGVYNPYFVTGTNLLTQCTTDTVRATITVVGPSHSGVAGSFSACNFGTFYLPNGLTGSVDAGGTWYDASNQALSGSTVTYNNQIPGNYNYKYTVSNGVCPASSTIIDVYVEQCASVNELNSSNFSLYPNPTSDDVFIQYGGVSSQVNIIITDAKGAIVYTESSMFDQDSNHKLELKNLQSGVYFIQLNSTTEQSAIKVIKN